MWLEKLREMKDKSGLTTREIAVRSGLPEPTLEKIFAGTTKDPKLTTIQQLVHFLGYTLDDLDPKTKKSPSAAEATPREANLVKLYRELNDEGQEKLVDYADDLVTSGKYIKTDSLGLEQRQA